MQLTEDDIIDSVPVYHAQTVRKFTMWIMRTNKKLRPYDKKFLNDVVRRCESAMTRSILGVYMTRPQLEYLKALTPPTTASDSEPSVPVSSQHE